jgi:16S rRNA (cytosine967-C5)-methyltransferase
MRGRLDHLLGPHVRRGLGSVERSLLEVLRLGAYQILYMGGVPTYAAVSEAVDQARSVAGPKPAGFVNAVLRKVADAGDGPERFPPESDDPAAFLAALGSHPRWLVERWLSRWDRADVKRLIAANNRRSAIYLNTPGISAREAVDRLAEAGLEAGTVSGASGAVRLGDGVSPSDALRAIPGAIVQDPAANLVSQYADIPSGTIVADLCAAPGGKLLALSDRPAKALAADRSESRIRMVGENAHRMGSTVDLVVADALHPPFREADVVLLDVPCTGTGTLSRHPDARWRLRSETVNELATLQAHMIESAASIVASGGLLVYSTCSLEPEENEERVNAFLRARSDFTLEPTGAVERDHLDDEGRLFVTPQGSGFDGAFAARMRKAQ